MLISKLKLIKKSTWFAVYCITFSFSSALAMEGNDALIEGMHKLSISRSAPSNIARDGIDSNKHTHTPQNGNTLYITQEANLSFKTKRKSWTLQVVPSSTKDLCTLLNHDLYFKKGLGGNSNHLFASLGITYTQV